MDLLQHSTRSVRTTQEENSAVVLSHVQRIDGNFEHGNERGKLTSKYKRGGEFLILFDDVELSIG